VVWGGSVDASSGAAPVVSVVIPTYNRAHIIGRAISSALAQTFQEWELLVVDDGSTDSTEEMVRRVQDLRVRYLRHDTRRGASAARNTGIRAARGEYVAFLDSDDEWLPKKLETQVEVFRRGPDVLGVVCTGWLSNASDGEVKRHMPSGAGRIYHRVLRGAARVTNTTSTLMCRRNVLVAVGGFDEALPALQDHDLWFKLSHVCEVDCLSEALAVYHTDDSSRISASPERVLEGHRLLLEKYATEFQRDRRALAWRLSLIGSLYYNRGALRESGRYYLESLSAFPFQPRVILRLILGTSPWLYRHRRFYRRLLNGRPGNAQSEQPAAGRSC
jgi:glycosyltransferase involved in cell wall biosynthesis